MNGVEELLKGLWTFPITLPKTPLRSLNCYVVRPDKGRSLLVDTGFPFPLCRKSLLDGIEALGLDMKNTDVFLTHLHSDHVGNAALLHDMGAEIYISKIDYDCWHGGVIGKWSSTFERTQEEGLPKPLSDKIIAQTASCLFMDVPEGTRTVSEGCVFSCGDYNFECILTPGHTPGHMCLYDKSKKLMLCGDHVLFDITPNIVSWPGVENSLKDYLESLDKIKSCDVELALPGHRARSEKTIYQRAEEIKAHHARRLNQILDILAENPGLCGYKLASRLSWKIKAADWDSFPDLQKYFALRETIAHLDYLLIDGSIRFEAGETRRYFLNK